MRSGNGEKLEEIGKMIGRHGASLFDALRAVSCPCVSFLVAMLRCCMICNLALSALD
jgi:hypothetical protein